jgi:hypothetical protein
VRDVVELAERFTPPADLDALGAVSSPMTRGRTKQDSGLPAPLTSWP